MALDVVGHYAQVWLKFSGNWRRGTKKYYQQDAGNRCSAFDRVQPSGVTIGSTVDSWGGIRFGSEGQRWCYQMALVRTTSLSDDASGNQVDQDRNHPDTGDGQDQCVYGENVANWRFHGVTSFTAIGIPVLRSARTCV